MFFFDHIASNRFGSLYNIANYNENDISKDCLEGTDEIMSPKDWRCYHVNPRVERCNYKEVEIDECGNEVDTGDDESSYEP